jgi:hypothetical protein
MDSFIGSDYVLLVELAMLGELREIPEIPFQKRVYPGMSNVVHKSNPGEWIAWLDSSRAGGRPVLPPSVNIGLECSKSVNRLPLSGDKKVRCHLSVPGTWDVRHLRNLGGLYKQKARQILGV